MTPVTRLYWAIAVILMPLSLLWLHSSIEHTYSIQALISYPFQLILFLVLLSWTLLGAFELFFCISNLRRNYPVLANLRYMLEYIRPEIQQYFIANNVEEKPFSRERRNLIYRRAKGADDTLPFGTEQDILQDGYRSIAHSLSTTEVDEKHERVSIGGPDCKQPYSASRLNISALSFGSLSSTAIAALNRGAALGNFAHNTGEGSISQHHLEHGGDIIWQIGTGYFGCRNPDGTFNGDAFQERASLDTVKMIEIKLSQGAKPSHGGVLPGIKVTEEISKIRLVQVGETVLSPPTHPEFNCPEGLLKFVEHLRNLSAGKPIGFKLCLGKKIEFLAIIKAMLKYDIYPDFITIDGAEGGTGAAPVEFSNRIGTPCIEATYFVNQILVGADIRDRVKIISSGQTATGFDMLEKIIVGADTVNAGRSMMMALGCIQAQSCNTNHCPTGIATQNASRARAIDVPEKSERVRNFHHATVRAFSELCGSMGHSNPCNLQPSDLYTRVGGEMKTFDQIYKPLTPGQLHNNEPIPEYYRDDWLKATASNF